MKTETKRMILTTAICLLPILAGLALYSRLPEQVPTHFDFNGNPDGWSSRAFAVFGIPGLMAAINLFLHICLEKDPKRANMSAALKHISLWVIPVLSVLTSGLTLGAAMGWPVHVETAIPVLVGGLFLLVGNYLPKTKQSYTMGIRLPWTLDSEENWNRTHRLTGFLWVAAGALCILFTLLHLWNGWLLAGLIALIALLPALYSCCLHRKGI